MAFKFNPITGQLDLVGSSSASIGTINSFAGYDGSGNLTSFSSFLRNANDGLTQTQSLIPPDAGSVIANQYTLDLFPSADLSGSTVYEKITQINLNGTNDFTAGFEGHEYAVTQTGNSDTGEIVGFFPRITVGAGGAGTSSNVRSILATVRQSGTHVAQNLISIESQVNQDSGGFTSGAMSFNGSTYIGGTTDYAYGLNQNIQIDGTVNNSIYGSNINVNVAGALAVNDSVTSNLSHTGAINGNFSGLNLNTQGNVGGSSSDISVYHQDDITQNSQMINLSRNGANLANMNGISINLNSTSPTTGDYRAIVAGNDSTVAENAAGMLVFQGGAISKSWTGYGMYLNADAGDGTSNIIGSDVSIQNHTIAGQISAFNFNNNSNVTGNNNTTGLNVNNQGTGYRFSAVTAYNNKNMTEEIRGFQFNSDNANARTGSGLDISMSGAFIDDVQGVRVNMNNTTTSSTSNHVHSGDFSGGSFSVQSAYTPFSGVGIEVGNNITMTSTILNGSPLTGTDSIVQLFQSNLLVQDDIATGPFGLDTNMIGMTSQVAVDSGKTVPLLRSLLVGTTVPMGSGGTITDHVVLELLGLPSFGGSVTNVNRIGIQDSQLIGQNFSDGVTGNCWFLKVNDPLALVSIASPTDVATLTTTVGGIIISNAGSGLEIQSGTNAKIGTSVLVGGTVTVSNTNVTVNSIIGVTSQIDGGIPGFLRVNNIIAGTSFDITSSNALDTSTVAWMIIESLP